MVAFGAISLGFLLTLAVTFEGDCDGEGVLEAHGFDDKGFLLLFGATTGSGLHAKRHLKKRRRKLSLFITM